MLGLWYFKSVFILFYFWHLLGTEPGAFHMLTNCFTPEPYSGTGPTIVVLNK